MDIASPSHERMLPVEIICVSTSSTPVYIVWFEMDSHSGFLISALFYSTQRAVIYMNNFINICKSQVKTLRCQNWHKMFEDGILKVVFSAGKDVARGTHTANGSIKKKTSWKWVSDMYQQLSKCVELPCRNSSSSDRSQGNNKRFMYFHASVFVKALFMSVDTENSRIWEWLNRL